MFSLLGTWIVSPVLYNAATCMVAMYDLGSESISTWLFNGMWCPISWAMSKSMVWSVLWFYPRGLITIASTSVGITKLSSPTGKLWMTTNISAKNPIDSSSNFLSNGLSISLDDAIIRRLQTITNMRNRSWYYCSCMTALAWSMLISIKGISPVTGGISAGLYFMKEAMVQAKYCSIFGFYSYNFLLLLFPLLHSITADQNPSYLHITP